MEREGVCPVPKHDISQLAEEVLEQVLYGNEGGTETCGEGVESGKDGERMEVWDSREEDGAGAKMSVQVNLFIALRSTWPLSPQVLSLYFPSAHIQEEEHLPPTRVLSVYIWVTA